MEHMDLDSQDSEDDDDHVPTFTPELAILKGKKVQDDEGEEDDSMSDGEEDIGPDEDPNKG